MTTLHVTLLPNHLNIGSVFLTVMRSGVQLSSWHGTALQVRCHSACCWSNVAPSTAVCIVIRSCGARCQQHVVHRLETGPSRLGGWWTTRMEQFASVCHRLL